ncbi:MAG: FixH [Bacteroidota bacterium]|jgi:hypothetical protein
MSFRNAVIVAMVAFIFFIGYMVVVINSEKSELIAEDYYAQEKTLDADLQAKQRAYDAGYPLEMKEHDGNLYFLAKNKAPIQKLHVDFLCFNDKQADLSFDIKAGQHFPVAQLKKGAYEIEMRYQLNGSTYLQQASFSRK